MITYSKGHLTIDFEELMEHLTDEDKLSLTEAMSCHDAIIKHVADQICNGVTENGYSGCRSCGAYAEPTSALDQATRQIALAAPEITAKEVVRLQDALKNAEDERDHYLQLLCEKRTCE